MQADTDDPPTTLEESLLAVGWDKNMFGYNGPYAPYTRISVQLTLAGLNPVFQSFFKDHIFSRTSLSIRDHLNRYRLMKISSAACEDVFGRAWAAQNGFPTNEWLCIERVNLTSIELRERGFGRMMEVETRIICPVAHIDLI